MGARGEEDRWRSASKMTTSNEDKADVKERKYRQRTITKRSNKDACEELTRVVRRRQEKGDLFAKGMVKYQFISPRCRRGSQSSRFSVRLQAHLHDVLNTRIRRDEVVSGGGTAVSAAAEVVVVALAVST